MPASSANSPSGARSTRSSILPFHRTDMVLETRPFRRQAGEDEAAIRADPRRAGEPERFLVEACARRASGTGTVTKRPSVSNDQP